MLAADANTSSHTCLPDRQWPLVASDDSESLLTESSRSSQIGLRTGTACLMPHDRYGPARRTLQIPPHIEQAVTDAVDGALETELGRRGLLLTAAELTAAAADAAHDGAQLLTAVLHRCYPIMQGSGAFTLEFEDDGAAARIETALAFGAAAARVVAREVADGAELLCAMFNLGIGLIDGLCDDEPRTGTALLDLLLGQDLAGAAERPRPRGWVRAAAPQRLVESPAPAFAVDVVEAFFETLHASYPQAAGLQLRNRVGAQLGAALHAERRSVTSSTEQTAREQLIEASRLTSVLPFEIIETLAAGEEAGRNHRAGTLLGEAMWKIDDLVDICEDARSGALNALLVATGETDDDVGAGLERMLSSPDLAEAASRAAENLHAALQPAGTERSRAFLSFVQRYAGIVAPDA